MSCAHPQTFSLKEAKAQEGLQMECQCSAWANCIGVTWANHGVAVCKEVGGLL